MKVQLPDSVKQYYHGYQQQAQQWWHKREPREQQLMALMAVLLGVLIFWYGLWQPLQNATVRGETRLANQQETLRHVVATTAQIEQLRNVRPAQRSEQGVSAAQLNGFISRTSAEFDLEVARLQPQSDSVQVTYNDASFDNLLAFLAALEARQVQIESIEIAEGAEPGMVRVRRLQVRAGS